MVEALYGQKPGRAGDSKEPWLRRLRDDGVFLVDLVPFPVNGLGRRERREALHAHVDDLVAEAVELDPTGVVVCHGPTFEVTASPLHAAGLRVLHDAPIPFPLGNWRAQFVDAVRTAVKRMDKTS